MDCTCKDILEYKKAIPEEKINIGDIIMIDTASGYITRAVMNKFPEPIINDSLVVGVCVGSSNDGTLRLIIDGGKSEEVERTLITGGNAYELQTIKIIGGSSEEFTPIEIIQVAYSGQHIVNVSGRTRVGDKLIISKEPGKGIAKRTFRDPDLYIRTLGKIIDYDDEDKTKAKVLLNIE